jgi:flagellar M-ring protein FliF
MAAANNPLPAVLQGFAELPARSKLGLMLATAALVALVTGSWMWSQVPEYRILFSNISDRDGGAIVAALGQMNVPYKYTEGGGAIMVPAAQVHDARLKLASQGLPKGGSIGFEVMENQKFGTTQFQEQVNFQRALEGELARTIQTLAAVQAARVHLAIPKSSVFLRDSQKPSASVMLNLHVGRTLDKAQISGIVHLIASSVPELSPQAVSVIDQQGSLLSGSTGTKGAGTLDANQLSYIAQIEANYSKRIQDLLEPIVGRANVRAQVSAELDFSESDTLAESYKPNQNQADAAIRSQQLSEEPRPGAAGGQGVPGALSNQPAPAPTAPLVGGAKPGGAAGQTDAQGNARRDSTINYEVDKTVRHTRNPTGNVKRLSAAVVVNYRKVAEAPAPKAEEAAKDDAAKADATKADAAKAPVVKAKPVPLSPEEMQSLTTLVKDTIGFSQARGDSVNVVNVAFTADDAVEGPVELPLWQQPEVIALAKEFGRNALIGGVALFLILGVLRPLLRQLATPPPIPEIPMQDQQLLEQEAEVNRYDEDLQAARTLARQDPRMVANVVKEWVGTNG